MAYARHFGGKWYTIKAGGITWISRYDSNIGIKLTNTRMEIYINRNLWKKFKLEKEGDRIIVYYNNNRKIEIKTNNPKEFLSFLEKELLKDSIKS